MNWIEKCKRAASAVPRDKRQQFLDLMWSGSTLGEAAALAGVTFDEANGIMALNISEVSVLNREAV